MEQLALYNQSIVTVETSNVLDKHADQTGMPITRTDQCK